MPVKVECSQCLRIFTVDGLMTPLPKHAEPPDIGESVYTPCSGSGLIGTYVDSA